ncbi:hypothetical protein FRC06_003532 [Ceratobasidium sp. 370]|nr:hypothetical protein FRC06_003532 [Ceratobasidium sp. 370]
MACLCNVLTGSINAEAEERRPTVANLHTAAKRMSRWKDVVIGTCRAKPDEFLQTVLAAAQQSMDGARLLPESGWSKAHLAKSPAPRAKGAPSPHMQKWGRRSKHYLEEFFPDDVVCSSGLFLRELEECDQQEADGEETLSWEMEGEDWKHDIGVDEFSSMGSAAPWAWQRLFLFAPPRSEAADSSLALLLKLQWHQLVGCGKMLPPLLPHQLLDVVKISRWQRR